MPHPTEPTDDQVAAGVAALLSQNRRKETTHAR